jgi:signal transduction histidine kinase
LPEDNLWNNGMMKYRKSKGTESSSNSKWIILISAVLIFSGLYLSRLYSYLLFHSLAEIFSIVVACGIFMVAWNSRRFLDNNYLLFLGIAYLFIGGIDLVHTLAYNGMGIFKVSGPNLPTQLWIVARYVESISLIIAPFLLDRDIKTAPVFAAFSAATCFLLLTIFVWRIFPDCFIEDQGITSFKKISEYIISLILLTSIALLYTKRKEFAPNVFTLLVASIIIKVCSELAFTIYESVFGLANLIGHFLKIISFYLIYKAIIETGFVRPYDLLFRNLKKSMDTSEALNRMHEVLHSTLEFSEIMQRIVDEGSALLRCDSAAVSLRQGDGWIVSHVHGMPSVLVGTRMEDDLEKHAVLALKSRQPVAVADAFNDDRFNKEHLRRHKIRSVLVTPLIARDEAVGVIFFNYQSAPHEFTVTEMNFAGQMASIAGAALANARLFEARKAAEDEIRKINRELEQRVKDRTAEIESQYKKLEELNTIIRQLSRKTIEAMETDRKALSKELHDSIAGTLAAIKMQLEARSCPSTQSVPSDLMPLDQIVAYLDEAIQETRSISRQLRSLTLDDFGLKAALVEHIRHFNQFYPEIEIASQIDIADEDIPAAIQTVIYRVVQEALNNVGKHSAAQAVHVNLANRQNRIWLEVADDGCGFEPEKLMSDAQSLMGFGLHSMRERVEICKGKFEIRSERGKGTTIEVSIPI